MTNTKKYNLDSQIDYVRKGAFEWTGGDAESDGDNGNGLTGTKGKKPKKKSGTRNIYVLNVVIL